MQLKKMQAEQLGDQTIEFATKTDLIDLSKRVCDRITNPSASDFSRKQLETREEVIRQLKTQVQMQESQFKHELDRILSGQ